MFNKKKQVLPARRVREADLEKYHEVGDFWDDEKIKAASRSKNLAWIISLISIIIAGISVFAVSQLASIKTVVPYVIEVNKLTGEVQVKKPLTDEPIPQYEAVSKFFLNKYIQARLGYDRNDFNTRFDIVTKMSTNEVANIYAKEVSTSNNKSPINLYGERGIVKVSLTNITFIENDVALIRLTEIARTAQGNFTSEFNATITFEYSDAPLDEETRLITPLGFVVSRFRKDPILSGQ